MGSIPALWCLNMWKSSTCSEESPYLVKNVGGLQVSSQSRKMKWQLQIKKYPPWARMIVCKSVFKWEKQTLHNELHLRAFAMVDFCFYYGITEYTVGSLSEALILLSNSLFQVPARSWVLHKICITVPVIFCYWPFWLRLMGLSQRKWSS